MAELQLDEKTVIVSKLDDEGNFSVQEEKTITESRQYTKAQLEAENATYQEKIDKNEAIIAEMEKL